MRSARPALLSLALTLGLTAATPAAALQTATASFTIELLETQVIDPADLPFGPGDTATVSYSFDESFVPSEDESGLLDYSGAFSSFQVTLGSSFTATFEPPEGFFIVFVSDDLSSPSPGGPEVLVDSLSINAGSTSAIAVGDLFVDAASAVFARVAGAQQTPDLIEGGALPVGGFGGFAFASAVVGFSNFSSVYVTNTVIPEPSTGLLAAGGLFALAQARRRFSV
jgi:hypothetical protein